MKVEKVKEIFESFENEDFVTSKETLKDELKSHMNEYFKTKLGLTEDVYSVDEGPKTDDMQIKLKGILKKIMDATSGSDNEKAKGIYKYANGMYKQIGKEGGLSKDQADWVWNTSKAMFKKAEA